MPNPRCLKCAHEIALDMATYLNYSGPVKCPHCAFAAQMMFSYGSLMAARPLLDEKLPLIEPHAIPNQPLGDYQEATDCLTVGAWKAAAVMARRAVQGALLAKGIGDDLTHKMIDEAYTRQLISEKQQRLSHTVRFFGGKGAHPQDSEVNQLDEIEAVQGLRVTKVLLLALFPPVTPPSVSSASPPPDVPQG